MKNPTKKVVNRENPLADDSSNRAMIDKDTKAIKKNIPAENSRYVIIAKTYPDILNINVVNAYAA